MSSGAMPRPCAPAANRCWRSDQRHPGLLEDRGGQARTGDAGLRPARPAGRLRRHAGPARPRQGARIHLRRRAGRAGLPPRATPAACARCSPTWRATPSSSPTKARSPCGRAWCRRPMSEAMIRFSVKDTGIGIPADKQETPVPEVHPGGRLDHAQVWRHRPGAGHLEAAGRDDGRRDRRRERGGPGL